MCVRACVRACVYVLSATQLVRLFAILGICSPPGSSVDGISQARILEWVAITPSGDLPDPGIKPMSPASPALAGRFFTTDPLGKPHFWVHQIFLNPWPSDQTHSSPVFLTLSFLIYQMQTVLIHICLTTYKGHAVSCLVAKAHLTFCDPMNCSSLGSSVHGILQARVLEWVAISFSRGSSQPRDRLLSLPLLHHR